MLSLIDRFLKRKPASNEKIKYIEQKFDYDCGQTCLEMLGYDGHNMFPDKALIREDLMSIVGVKEESYENIRSLIPSFPEEPCIFSVRMVADVPEYHWILVYENKVYCPSFGVFTIEEYLENIWSPLAAFQIPFAEDMKHTIVSGNQE
ncbi:MAG TPA: hypothetical protein ENI22_00550 [Candidatus Pacearchaeota archaeon]|nr:hypothetical protein [Candidatus Pacearchaeota archaeon]